MLPAPSVPSLKRKTSCVNLAVAGIALIPLKSNTNSSQAPEVVTGIFKTATPLPGVPPTAHSN